MVYTFLVQLLLVSISLKKKKILSYDRCVLMFFSFFFFSILNSRRLELWRRLDSLDLPAISLLDGANIISRDEIHVQPNQFNSVHSNKLPEHRPFQFSGTLEMVVIIIGSVSFFAILAVAICIGCIRQSLNRYNKKINY